MTAPQSHLDAEGRPTEECLAEVAARLTLLRTFSDSPKHSSGIINLRSVATAPAAAATPGVHSGRASPSVLTVQSIPEWAQMQPQNESGAQLQGLRRQHLLMAANAAANATLQQANASPRPPPRPHPIPVLSYKCFVLSFWSCPLVAYPAAERHLCDAGR